MKITKVEPRGFCKGVIDAWVLTKKIRQENPNAKIYMIGWLVHNEHMLNNLKEINVDVIDDKEISRLDIIKNLEVDDNTIIIFSAHGTDQKAIDLAKKRNIKYFDATCKYVSKIFNIIKSKIRENNKIIFLGKENHPETKAIKSINKDIITIYNIDELRRMNLDNNASYFVTNQTTMSMYEFEEVYKYLKEKLKNVVFENEICTATIERQNAVLNMDSDVDILIVVGDNRSNNSQKLCEIGNKIRKVDSYLILDESHIDESWFKNKNHVAITSGASTPTWITNNVIEYIKRKWGDNE